MPQAHPTQINAAHSLGNLYWPCGTELDDDASGSSELRMQHRLLQGAVP